MTHSSVQRLPHKFLDGLAAALLIALMVHLVPAQATELPASPSTESPAPRVHHRHAHMPGRLALRSSAAFVVDQDNGETLVMKNPDAVMPIASLTKLMTALVVINARQPMDEVLQVTRDDVDTIRHSRSRLRVGTRLSRRELLLLALMSSENRAAMALSRNYPGGRGAFIAQMNAKALALGMRSTHFADPAGLSNGSRSTARDLHLLLDAAYAQPLIRHDTTHEKRLVRIKGGRTLTYINSNRLVRSADSWNIGLQKTGFTNQAGHCLVMRVTVEGHHLAMVFLDSMGKLARYADAARVRRLFEIDERKALTRHMTASSASEIYP